MATDNDSTKETVMVMVKKLATPLADVFIGMSEDDCVDYHYGGTRLLPPDTTDSEATQTLLYLMTFESTVKNKLINLALAEGAVEDLSNMLPSGFVESKVSGGRCLIRPVDVIAYSVLSEAPGSAANEYALRSVLKPLGEELNTLGGRLKLTPDFGRYAGLADVLYLYTPHSLGIKCPDGGCGGKASYTATGVKQAIDVLSPQASASISLIGSCGAIGSDVLDSILAQTRFSTIAVCDYKYDEDPDTYPVLGTTRHVASEKGRFAADSLKADVIVACTYGGELEQSPYWKLRPQSLMMLAHNIALSYNDKSAKVINWCDEHNVDLIPGQILTLGGSLTSRLEWFWRVGHPGIEFDKPLAHKVVSRVTSFLVERVSTYRQQNKLPWFDSMFAIIDFDPYSQSGNQIISE